MKKQTKEGISLIVLVITIIVMIIIAGAVVITLSNSNIIDRANEAKTKYEMAQAQTLAAIGYAEAYTANPSASKAVLIQKTLEYMENGGLNSDEFGVTVVSGKIIVTDKSRAWVRDGMTVRRGEQVLNIGDTVKYGVGLKSGDEWRVLGVGDGGELLITTLYTQKPGQIALGVKNDPALSMKNYVNGYSILDDACSEYINKEEALYVRNITADDINTVTGFIPGTTIAGYDFLGTAAGLGYEYVLSYNTSKKTYDLAHSLYSQSYTAPGGAGNADSDHTTFTWYSVSQNKFYEYSKAQVNGKKITNTYYLYDTGALSNWTDDGTYRPHETIFTGALSNSGNAYANAYWVSNRYSKVDTDHVSYGYNYVGSNDFGAYSFIRSKGTSKDIAMGVKPVVGIDPSVEITKVN